MLSAPGPTKMVEFPSRWTMTKKSMNRPVTAIKTFLPTVLVSISMAPSLFRDLPFPRGYDDWGMRLRGEQGAPAPPRSSAYSAPRKTGFSRGGPAARGEIFAFLYIVYRQRIIFSPRG